MTNLKSIGLAGRLVDERTTVIDEVTVPLDEGDQVGDNATLERHRRSDRSRRVTHLRDERLVRESF